ncbi:MAG: hypothetical protein GWP19_01810 [Planctomycetia bacterium]|nr:hypothetical protein [Planctomycetia bacterium]
MVDKNYKLNEHKKMFKSIKNLIIDVRKVSNLEEELKCLREIKNDLVRNYREEKADIESRHNIEITEKDAKLEEDELKKDNEIARIIAIETKRSDNEIAEAKEAYEKKFNEVRDDLFEAENAKAISEGVVELNKFESEKQQNHIDNLKGIIDELIKVIPKVNLEKFNINVDVPEPKVIVKDSN